MKLKQKESNLEILGEKLESVSSFIAKENAHKMMELVIGIYSDPLLAVIRELTSNAYDANVDKGDPNAPLLIGLYEKVVDGDYELVIKDEGKGMSQSFMKNKFVSIFHSTKENSDNPIGCFGIGSKSPLNYYTNTAIFECISEEESGKVLTSWLLSKDNGKAAITKLYEQPTFEHTGTTVKIPIDKEDINQVLNKSRQLVFFPNIIFDGFLKENNEIIYEEYDDYYEISSDYLGNVVAIGPVLYTYSTNLFSGYSNTIVPKFKIGELEIGPTREKISENHFNNKQLSKKLNKILFELGKNNYKKFKNTSLIELLNNNRYKYDYKRNHDGPNERLIEDYTTVNNIPYQINRNFYNSLITKYNLKDKLNNRISGVKLRKFVNGNLRVFNKTDNFLDNPRKNYKVFLNDLGVKSISKYVKTIDLQENNYVIIVNDNSLRNWNSNTTRIKLFLDFLGGYDYKFSEITPLKRDIVKKLRDFTSIKYLEYQNFLRGIRLGDSVVKISELEDKNNTWFYSYVGNAKSLSHKTLDQQELKLIQNKHPKILNKCLLLTSINEYKRLISMKSDVNLIEIKDIVEEINNNPDMELEFLYYLFYKESYNSRSNALQKLKMLKPSIFNTSISSYIENKLYRTPDDIQVKYWLKDSRNHTKAQELFKLVNHILLYPDNLLQNNLDNLKSLYIFDKTYRPESISLASKYIYDIPKMNEELETLSQTYTENITFLNKTIQEL